MKDIKLGNAFFDSIQKDSLLDLSSEISELTIDMLTDNEVIKSIPIVGLLVKSFGACSTVRDFLLTKKILIFLQNINNISKVERKKFIENINSKERTKIGEQIILLLDRHETIEKSKILALIFKSYIVNKVTKDEFDQLCDSIDRLFIQDLDKLFNFTTQDYSTQKDLQRLYFSGLLDLNLKNSTSSFNFDKSTASYELSDLGKKLLNILS